MSEPAEPTPTTLPVAHLPLDNFAPLDLLEFGHDADIKLVGRPLSSVTLFSDSKTGLPCIYLLFSGQKMLSDAALLVSPRPTRSHPFASLDTLVYSGAALDQIRYTREQPADQPTQEPDHHHEWAARTDQVGQLRAVVLHLAAVGAALEDGELLTQDRRQELADLLKPVIKTFEGAIAAELARQAEEPR